MSKRMTIELVAIRAIIELPDTEHRPAVVETHSGEITLSERPGLAKTLPNAPRTPLRLVSR